MSDFLKDISSVLIGGLNGTAGTAIEIIKRMQEESENVSEKLFLKNFETVIKGLDEKKTYERKVGKKLAKSSYGEEYGFTLLKYIDSFEHTEKGTYLAYLIDATSKGFVDADDCFAYGRLISQISLRTLKYLKNNIRKGVVEIKEQMILNEMKRFDLVYEADGGYAYDLLAYNLDKYAVSYLDESKYKYNREKDSVPGAGEFPEKVSYLIM